MSAKEISLNGLDIQSENYIVSDILYRNTPSKSLNILQKSRNDGFVLQSMYYTEKNITVSGNINCSTEADLKTKIDTLKEYTSGTDEFNVDIDDAGNTMRFVCSLESLNIPEKHYNITNVPFNISLKCQPFGKYTTATTDSKTITNASASPYLNTLDPTGSVAPKPVLKWTVATGTPTTAITQIVFTNTTTGDAITVAALALDAVGDYLEIDCENLTVSVSHDGNASVSIDYVGVFPSFNIGINSYFVSITGGSTSWNLTQLISYYPTYI